ncbi:MAG TPA: zinc ribbon domain-containing protein [Candidatus Marinimicrobia bacterium]|nr:FmdB family transcriptional regulator [Candidatus Neomarinimicrobiota bacterium]HIA91374.1 zinc ribbon domain-containing protein [Candidatus Neomarinimicrobiota bacterium]HIB61477.1 zinc ribbon domain-containing protein [Candidatus Neomarinimicrobiota bacterium]
MPTYDYICNKCGHTFELFQSMTETPRKTCPVCKRVVRRLVSGGSGLIFKGSGFYLTDYKNDKKPPKDKKETKKKEPSKTVKKAKD